MKKHDNTIFAALDIGTAKVTCLIGKLSNKGDLEIIGSGVSASAGLKRGVVINIEDTMQAINIALEQAEAAAQVSVRAVYVGISGGHISGINSDGIVAVRNNKEVVAADVDRVIESARAVAIPSDKQILHVLPQEFCLDNQDGIHNPVGMSGVRLEAKVHLVTGGVSAAQNITKCVERCGLQVNDLVFQALAAKEVLTDDEQELGVCLVDIGAGTTDIIVFIDNAVRHTAVIPIAGDQVTNDIAVTLRTPTSCAERLKTQTNISSRDLDLDEILEVASVVEHETQQVPKKMLVDVAKARYEELFLMVAAELRRSGFYDQVASGIVLTGGGSKVSCAAKLAERIFELPVRIAKPKFVAGLPVDMQELEYSSALGLLLYIYRQIKSEDVVVSSISETNVMKKMKQWLQYHF